MALELRSSPIATRRRFARLIPRRRATCRVRACGSCRRSRPCPARRPSRSAHAGAGADAFVCTKRCASPPKRAWNLTQPVRLRGHLDHGRAEREPSRPADCRRDVEVDVELVAGEPSAPVEAATRSTTRAHQGQLPGVRRSVRRPLAAATLPHVADEALRPDRARPPEHFPLALGGSADDQLDRPRPPAHAGSRRARLELLRRQMSRNVRGHAPVLSRRRRRPPGCGRWPSLPTRPGRSHLPARGGRAGSSRSPVVPRRRQDLRNPLERADG